MQPEVKFVRALLWMLAGALGINAGMAAVVYGKSPQFLILGALGLVIVLLWTRPKGDKS